MPNLPPSSLVTDLISGVRELFIETLQPSQLLLRILGRFHSFRSFMLKRYSSRLSTKILVSEPQGSKHFTSTISHKPFLKSLYQDGITDTFSLKQDSLYRLLDYAYSVRFTSEDNTSSYLGRDIISPTFLPEYPIYRRHSVDSDSPLVRSIVTDPLILYLAEQYLGLPPIVGNCQLYFSLPNRSSTFKRDQKRYFSYHYDIDDYRFLKLFIYLTDVSGMSGPHCYVKTSHLDYSLTKKICRRISQATCDHLYPDQACSILGSAGTSFMEDTFGFHRGAPPNRPRLILHAEYFSTTLSQQ